MNSSPHYDISESRFSLQVTAPPGVIRELAICKGVWLAEKKNVPTIWFGDPIYNDPVRVEALPITVPDGWAVLRTTVYLTDAGLTSNPSVSVPEKAAQCRSGWDWYR